MRVSSLVSPDQKQKDVYGGKKIGADRGFAGFTPIEQNRKPGVCEVLPRVLTTSGQA